MRLRKNDSINIYPMARTELGIPRWHLDIVMRSQYDVAILSYKILQAKNQNLCQSLYQNKDTGLRSIIKVKLSRAWSRFENGPRLLAWGRDFRIVIRVKFTNKCRALRMGIKGGGVWKVKFVYSNSSGPGEQTFFH